MCNVWLYQLNILDKNLKTIIADDLVGNLYVLQYEDTLWLLLY